MARTAILLTVLGLAGLGGAGWWLLQPAEPSGSDPQHSSTPARVLPRPAGTGPVTADERSPEESAAISARRFGDPGSDLTQWIGRLEAALKATRGRQATPKASIELEAISSAIRMAMLETEAAGKLDLASLLQTTKIVAARKEIIPLWIDVMGAPRVERLQSWLSDQPLPVRSAAYARLARLGPSGRQDLDRVLPNEDDERAGSEALTWLLRRDGRDALTSALRAAPSKEALISSAIIGVLSNPQDKELAQALRQFMDEDLDYKMRQAIADALATTYPDELRETPAGPENLSSRAGDLDPVTRSLALKEAGNFMDTWKRGKPDPEKILGVRDLVREAALQDPDPLVRRAAILSRVGLRPNIKNLKTQCETLLELAGHDRDPGVRAAVLKRVHRGCAHTRMPFGPDYLVEFIDRDPNPDVRREALRTLPRYAGTPHIADARRLLVKALRRDQDPGVRLEAAALLTELGFDFARPHLLRAARNDQSPQFREALWQSARDQLAETNPAFVAELARLEQDREFEMPPSAPAANPAASPNAQPTILQPDYRMVTERPPIALDPEAMARLLGRVKPTRTREATPNSSTPNESWATQNVTLRADDGTMLHGYVYQPKPSKVEPRLPMLFIVPMDDLIGSVSVAWNTTSIKRMARAKNVRLFSYSPRGRGRSEGWWQGPKTSRTDLASAINYLLSTHAPKQNSLHFLAIGNASGHLNTVPKPPTLAPTNLHLFGTLDQPPATPFAAFERTRKPQRSPSLHHLTQILRNSH